MRQREDKSIEEWRSKKGSKWSAISKESIICIWVMGRKTRVKLDREIKPMKVFMHGAIKSRKNRVFWEFIRRSDEIMDTETFPQIEEVLTAIDPKMHAPGLQILCLQSRASNQQ